MKALVDAFNQEKALVGAFFIIVKTDGSLALLKTCNNTASTPQLCTVTILWDSYYLREHLRIKHKMKMITYKNKVVNNYNENITGSRNNQYNRKQNKLALL